MSWRRVVSLLALMGGNSLMLWLILRAIDQQVERTSELQMRVVGETAKLMNPPPPVERSPAVQPPMSSEVELEEDVPVWAMGMTSEEYRQMVADGVDPMTGRPLR